MHFLIFWEFYKFHKFHRFTWFYKNAWFQWNTCISLIFAFFQNRENHEKPRKSAFFRKNRVPKINRRVCTVFEGPQTPYKKLKKVWGVGHPKTRILYGVWGPSNTVQLARFILETRKFSKPEKPQPPVPQKSQKSRNFGILVPQHPFLEPKFKKWTQFCEIDKNHKFRQFLWKITDFMILWKCIKCMKSWKSLKFIKSLKYQELWNFHIFIKLKKIFAKFFFTKFFSQKNFSQKFFSQKNFSQNFFSQNFFSIFKNWKSKIKNWKFKI